jgi:hypothetical protein
MLCKSLLVYNDKKRKSIHVQQKLNFFLIFSLCDWLELWNGTCGNCPKYRKGWRNQSKKMKSLGIKTKDCPYTSKTGNNGAVMRTYRILQPLERCYMTAMVFSRQTQPLWGCYKKNNSQCNFLSPLILCKFSP